MLENRTHIPGLNPTILKHFGLNDTGQHDSISCQNVRKQLELGIRDHKMQNLIAPFGAGKTYLFRQLKRNIHNDVKFVHVKAFDDKWIRIGSILTAIITDLAPKEGVRRDIETRSRQVINILGEHVVDQQNRICLVIEDCHRLHVNTLNSLKLMREEDYAGFSPLFGIVMIGWPEFLAKLSNRKDILWRMQTIKLNPDSGWFTMPERVKYLDNVFGHAIEADTRKRIAMMHETPEGLNNYVATIMRKAYNAGYSRIDELVVQPSLKERYETIKKRNPDRISYSKLGKIAGVGKSTVSLAIESEPDTPATQKVSSAMDELEERINGSSNDNRKTA